MIVLQLKPFEKLFRFMLMENTRRFLYQYDPDESLLIGKNILSKKALSELVEKVFISGSEACNKSAESVNSLAGRF